jgi:septal ring factor EnvC (AmiA/AmiB activator)
MRSSRSAHTTPGTACPVRDRGAFVTPPLRASVALGLAAFVLLAQSALIPAHATDANEPESSSVASDLEQEQEASRLELRSVADEARLAAKALAALEDDIAALRADQQELDRRIAETAARRADLDRRITAGEQSMTGLSERQESVRLSLMSRRAVLAEVLARCSASAAIRHPHCWSAPKMRCLRSAVRSCLVLWCRKSAPRPKRLAADLKELAALQAGNRRLNAVPSQARWLKTPPRKSGSPNLPQRRRHCRPKASAA